MSTDEQQTARYRKPDLSRAQPIRRVSGVLGRQSVQALEPTEPRELPASPAVAAGSGGSAVADGVRAGYQVIDDYLRQGRESAAQARAAAPPQAAAAAPNSPDKLTERFFQYASDLTAVWLELMQATMLNTAPAAVQNDARVQGSGAGPFELRRPPCATPAAVSSEPRRSPAACAIRLRSARPVDARCELFDDAPLDVHVGELRPQDPALPSLRGVTLGRDAQSGRLQLTLNIDHAQPAAAYSGLIVDRATHAPAGLVYVRLMDELA